MNPKLYFRAILVLSLLSIAAGILAGLYPETLNHDWEILLEWNGHDGLIEKLSNQFILDTRINWYVAIPILLLLGFSVFVEIGLFLFWGFARHANVFLQLVSIAYDFFGGLVVMTPLQSSIYQFQLILNGVIIGASYLQPINSFFQNTK